MARSVKVCVDTVPMWFAHTRLIERIAVFGYHLIVSADPFISHARTHTLSVRECEYGAHVFV